MIGQNKEDTKQVQKISKIISNEQKSERPYTCNQCSKCFRTGSYLREHVEGVHDKRRYQCGFCPNFFYVERKLRKHLVERHNPPT